MCVIAVAVVGVVFDAAVGVLVVVGVVVSVIFVAVAVGGLDAVNGFLLLVLAQLQQAG